MSDVPGRSHCAVARSVNAMVAAPHAAAASAGLDMLRRGGTAVDAAVAANAVLAVVYPASCGLGGDALAMVYEPRTNETVCYNGSGRAPAKLEAAALRERGFEAMPVRGALTVTVPGAVRAWHDMLEAHGRLSLDEALQQAETYASDGFAVTDVVAASYARAEPLLRADPHASDTFLANGCPRAGDLVRNPALARTIRDLRAGGPAAFYGGRVGEALARALRVAGNPMTLDDLNAVTTQRASPLRVGWRGADVLAHPPNSQGALALVALGTIESDPPHDEREWYHVAIEALKLAFDERDARFADPGFMPGPIDDLLRAECFLRLRARIEPGRARRHSRTTWGGGTVAVVAVDGDGRAVSLLQSLFMGFGSGLVAADTGVVLHNRGAYFSLEPGVPNELRGGKRPLHTLSPGMLLRDGRPELVYGTMGGDGQVQTHVQLLHGIYDMKRDVQAAIDHARFVYGRDSESAYRDLVRVESRMPGAVVDALREVGHVVEVLGPYDGALGHAQAIAIDRPRGTLAGGADPRADSAALGL